MIAQELLRLRTMLQDEGIMFCYSGYVTEEVLSSIGKALRSKLTNETGDKKVVRNLFSLFVEQVQNIIRYSTEREENKNGEEPKDLSFGVFIVGKAANGRYYVTCGNLVHLADVPRLRGNLDHIRSLDRDGINALYKQILRGEVPEGSKGAGVGFVDMARTATHGFEYDFLDIDAKSAFFSFKAYV
ncbi:MAG: hypothetical protein HQL64_14770 [Magnetococcales bacterium]|nr:hypothetical protein [Magnetococcales bacterium]